MMDAIAEAAAGANRYPDNGSVAVRDALAAKLGVSADRITTGCGSVGICLELVQATSGPGDEVIYAWRSFEAYPVVVKVAGATPVEVPLTADYEHDLDAMLAAITDRTRLIFICNPNNPTGTVLDAEALARFLDAVPRTSSSRWTRPTTSTCDPTRAPRPRPTASPWPKGGRMSLYYGPSRRPTAWPV
ncbi:cys/Met metabolism PLP-dependent enzyme family protein [Rhodococcus sp. MTM3W5.2]|nr:cys/Met metabolism PLP-dependent enzyme family protein [Rhodococcus sp. MTM3W5.2]